MTVEATITPLRDDRGEIAGYVGAQRDVTRERASEALALRVARERALVADMLAHLPAGPAAGGDHRLDLRAGGVPRRHRRGSDVCVRGRRTGASRSATARRPDWSQRDR